MFCSRHSHSGEKKMTRIVHLQRAFWTSVAVSVAWMAIPLGIYYTVQGIMGISTILIFAVGILAIVLALLDSIAERLTSMRVELWRITAFLVIFLYFGLSQVFGTVTSISISSSEQAFFAGYRVITVVTMAVVLWQLVRTVRNSSVSTQ